MSCSFTFYLLPFTKGFVLNLKPASAISPLCLLPHSVGITGPDAYAATASFLGSCGRFEDSGLHVCIAKTLAH